MATPSDYILMKECRSEVFKETCEVGQNYGYKSYTAFNRWAKTHCVSPLAVYTIKTSYKNVTTDLIHPSCLTRKYLQLVHYSLTRRLQIIRRIHFSLFNPFP